MPSQPSLQASRYTIAPSSAKHSLKTILSCEPRNSSASNSFRFSIGSPAQVFAVQLKQIERAMHGAGHRAMAAD